MKHYLHLAQHQVIPNPKKHETPSALSAQVMIQDEIYKEQAKNLAKHFLFLSTPVRTSLPSGSTTQNSKSAENRKLTQADVETVMKQLLNTEQEKIVNISSKQTAQVNITELFTHTLKLYNKKQMHTDINKRVTFINTLRHPDIGAHQTANKLSKDYLTWQSLISE